VVAKPVVESEFRGARERLVETLREKGIRDLAVLRAFEKTPRHAFVPTGLRHRAYEDAALPIGNGQTISQPWVHARYLELLQLKGDERVLEIGTGSGYAAAILGSIAREVYTVERHAALAEAAAARLHTIGLHSVHVLHGDGTRGWPEHAPYDAIVVTAGGPQVPPALLEQLAPGGRLVVPVGGGEQELRVYERTDGGVGMERICGVAFVPMTGGA